MLREFTAIPALLLAIIWLSASWIKAPHAKGNREHGWTGPPRSLLAAQRVRILQGCVMETGKRCLLKLSRGP